MAGFTREDVAYLSHGDRKIMARIFKPEGAGPFPCFINLHGGAWNQGDLADSTGLGEYLASRGVVMPTLNFRHGQDGYPTTLADIHYGIRWVKAHAKQLNIDRIAIQMETFIEEFSNIRQRNASQPLPPVPGAR